VSELRFYHLQRKTLEQALPELLEKAYGRGMRALVLTASEERAEQLSQHLWSYKPESFLPHGTARDGRPEEQPIFLSAEDANVNGATVLFLVDGAESRSAGDYALCCDLFDGADDEALAAARRRWSGAKQAGHALTYWQQTDKGWEKKASSEGQTPA
jgi:DNA polymerase-3 subunit chi